MVPEDYIIVFVSYTSKYLGPVLSEKKEDMVSKGNAHREQSFHIRVQIGTQQAVCQKLIFNVVHRRNRGYTAYIV